MALLASARTFGVSGVLLRNVSKLIYLTLRLSIRQFTHMQSSQARYSTLDIANDEKALDCSTSECPRTNRQTVEASSNRRDFRRGLVRSRSSRSYLRSHCSLIPSMSTSSSSQPYEALGAAQRDLITSSYPTSCIAQRSWCPLLVGVIPLSSLPKMHLG